MIQWLYLACEVIIPMFLVLVGLTASKVAVDDYNIAASAMAVDYFWKDFLRKMLSTESAHH